MNKPLWPYPGSRWWKFDFHTHTPASRDTYWARNNIDLSPEDWLLKYMAAEIDCVAVTDHNSGEWVDRLKDAYAQMKAQADAGTPPTGFRELTIFPGVEISVNGGIHVLAIFDPTANTATITSLLGAVGFPAYLHGATDSVDAAAVTRASIVEVLEEVMRAGGIPIPAHADDPKGLLQCRAGSNGPALDANTLRQALAVEGLMAVEWCDRSKDFPECVRKDEPSFAKVLGSDCHSFQGTKVPGSAYTWVKMAKPTLEGLRLALLDGNDVSIRRSDEGDFDPFKLPAHRIRCIEIDKARYMGNGQAARIAFSPYFNAIVGGRGTGKSTIVQALRLVLARGDELKRLAEDAEPRQRFDDFCKVAKGRDGVGALRDDTEFRVEWEHEDRRSRLVWRTAAGVIV
ncbi:MAG TPA: AAA family ATPase, partial [Firmicutes bacterium]|nr:AAA family ATPase [Candidatus Fermentithermobacillaceae bacterium]